MLLAGYNGDRMKQSQNAPQELTMGRSSAAHHLPTGRRRQFTGSLRFQYPNE
jgi:hypothetical protein